MAAQHRPLNMAAQHRPLNIGRSTSWPHTSTTTSTTISTSIKLKVILFFYYTPHSNPENQHLNFAHLTPNTSPSTNNFLPHRKKIHVLLHINKNKVLFFFLFYICSAFKYLQPTLKINIKYIAANVYIIGNQNEIPKQEIKNFELVKHSDVRFITCDIILRTPRF